MRKLSLQNDGIEACCEAASRVLAAGGLAVGPTDTLYGIFAAWDDQQAVERLYALKGRDQEKRLLVLVSGRRMAEGVAGVPLPAALLHYWPGPLTAILPAGAHPFGWETQAVRLPDDDFSRGLARHLGKPVYAPSANHQGQSPARTCEEAESMFGDEVDLYIDGGAARTDAPSTIISLAGAAPVLVRQGIIEVTIEDFA